MEQKFRIRPIFNFTFSFLTDVASAKKVVLVATCVLTGYKFSLHLNVVFLGSARREGKEKRSGREGSKGCQCSHAPHCSQKRDGRKILSSLRLWFQGHFSWCLVLLQTAPSISQVLIPTTIQSRQLRLQT